ncbi:MAG: helix-turn-helix transcriptional regulator [Christensenellaceae bacterium]
MFGKNIKELRIEKNMSQKMLADRIGVTQGAVYFWEKEINEPTVGYIVKLATVFGVSIDELLSYEVQKEKKENTKRIEMMAMFDKLSDTQQSLLISTAKELLQK